MEQNLAKANKRKSRLLDSSLFMLVRMKARNRKENATIPSETFVSGREYDKEMVIALAAVHGQAQVDGWI